MTPGLLIALAAVALLIVIAAVAIWRGRFVVAEAAMAAIIGLALTRIIKVVVPDDAHLVAMGAIWVTVGSIVLRGGIKSACTPSAIAGGLFVASGLCYALADWFGAAMSVGSAPMVMADASGFAGVFALFWGSSGGQRVKDDLGNRDRMARDFLGAGGGRGADVAGGSAVGSGNAAASVRGGDSGFLRDGEAA